MLRGNNGAVNEPSQPSLLPRRIAASLVDLGLVGGLWLLVLYRLAVRFEIAQREPNGTPIYAQNQREALAEIATGLNFGRVIGDFYYSIHGRGLVLGFLSLIIFSLIAWVLVPANTGWSAGHRALGLQVTDMKGGKPPLDSYLRRYLVGLVDLFPYVIPGLLGWVIASRNEHNQRFGDLSADTKVVAATTQPIGTMPEVTTTVIRPKDKAAQDSPPAPADPSAMVDVEEALAGHTISEEPAYPVMNLERTADAVPTIESDPPPPTGRGIALSESIPLSDEPAADSDFVASLNDHEEVVLAESDEVVADLPEASFAENWHFPEAQDAPVWTPEPISNNGPKAADVPDEEPAATAAESAPKESETAAATAAGMGDPVWNEEWAAWLYWDAKGGKWLRHDAENGWTPIGDSQKA